MIKKTHYSLDQGGPKCSVWASCFLNLLLPVVLNTLIVNDNCRLKDLLLIADLDFKLKV